jgi:hypothetical protein
VLDDPLGRLAEGFLRVGVGAVALGVVVDVFAEPARNFAALSTQRIGTSASAATLSAGCSDQL